MTRLSPPRLLLVVASAFVLVAAGLRLGTTSWVYAAQSAKKSEAASLATGPRSIRISGSTCTTDCVVRVEEVRHGDDSLFDTIRVRNQTNTAITSIWLESMMEADWETADAPIDPGMGPMMAFNSPPLTVDLPAGKSVDLHVKFWKMKEDVNPRLSLEPMLTAFNRAWKELGDRKGFTPPRPAAHVEVVAAERADGTKWSIVVKRQPLTAEDQAQKPQDCVTPNGHKVKHASVLSTPFDVEPGAHCAFGAFRGMPTGVTRAPMPLPPPS